MNAFVSTDIGPQQIDNADMLRLHHDWRNACKGADLPTIADLPVTELWCSDNLMLVESQGDDYRYLHYGASIAHSSGFDMTGRRISDFKSQTGTFFHECYDRCRRERIPLYTVHRAAHATLVTEWERLLLPLADVHGDVTQVLAFNRPLGYQHELLHQVLSALSDIVIGVQHDGPLEDGASLTVSSLNRAAEHYFGVSAVDTIGLPLSSGLPGWISLGLHGDLTKCAARQLPVERTWTDLSSDPHQHFRVTFTPYEAGVVIMMSDITTLVNKTGELEQLNSDLRHIANTDALTQVVSRRHFLEICEQETARSARYGESLSVVYMDIDHFKRINDMYGHAVGDEVLVKVAALTRSMTRACDSVGRLGGEEFAILLPHAALGPAMDFAARVRDRIASTLIRVDKQSINVTCSFGVAQHQPGTSVDRLLNAADAALYEAKKTGRNRVKNAANS